jgi:hypothetical protein
VTAVVVVATVASADSAATVVHRSLLGRRWSPFFFT